MQKNKKSIKGFTIIEVTLVLAVSALLFAGLVINVTNNISTQRYATTVQDFNSFLKQVYNQVANTQINSRSSGTTERSSCTIDGAESVVQNTLNNSGSGRTNCSVYGKLVVFGDTSESDNTIYVYDVIGEAVDLKNPISANSEIEAYRAVKMGILAVEQGKLTSNYYTYVPDWQGLIEDTNGETLLSAILVVRSPLSGTIHTYVRAGSSSNAEPFKIRKVYNSISGTITDDSAFNSFSNNIALLTTELSDGKYQPADVDFCVESDDRRLDKPRNIRLMADAHSSLDIILVDQDGGENKCPE